MDENSVYVVFRVVNDWHAIKLIDQIFLFGTKVKNTLDVCRQLLLTK